eukprot:355645-Chlamydomonas_euryale.AAC.9
MASPCACPHVDNLPPVPLGGAHFKHRLQSAVLDAPSLHRNRWLPALGARAPVAALLSSPSISQYNGAPLPTTNVRSPTRSPSRARWPRSRPAPTRGAAPPRPLRSGWLRAMRALLSARSQYGQPARADEGGRGQYVRACGSTQRSCLKCLTPTSPHTAFLSQVSNPTSPPHSMFLLALHWLVWMQPPTQTCMHMPRVCPAVHPLPTCCCTSDSVERVACSSASVAVARASPRRTVSRSPGSCDSMSAAVRRSEPSSACAAASAARPVSCALLTSFSSASRVISVRRRPSTSPRSRSSSKVAAAAAACAARDVSDSCASAAERSACASTRHVAGRRQGCDCQDGAGTGKRAYA